MTKLWCERLVCIQGGLLIWASLTLADRVGSRSSRLNDYSNATKDSTNHHSNSAAPGITGRTDEGKSDNSTDLVHGSDNTGPRSGTLDVVILLECIVGKERVKHGSVETVTCRAKEANKCADVE